MARSDFVPLGGTSRRYLNPRTGEILSRRQFEKQHGRPGGALRPGQTFEQLRYERAAAQGRIATIDNREVILSPPNAARYRSLVEDFRDSHRLTGGVKMSYREARRDPEMQKLIRDLNELKHAEQKFKHARSVRWRDYWNDRINKLRDPKGKIAKGLKNIGRKAEHDYSGVGETPT